MQVNPGYRGPLARASEEQKEFLVNYMIQHPSFRENEFHGNAGRKKISQRWEKLASKLNGFKAGAQKPVRKWMKVSTNEKISKYAGINI